MSREEGGHRPHLIRVDANAGRERSMRRRILKAGTICFNLRHSTRPCSIRNMSEGGARIQVEGAMTVPDTFELHIPLDGIWAECEVVWRGRDSLGVRFLAPVRTEKPTRKQVVQLNAPTQKPSLRRAGARLPSSQ